MSQHYILEGHNVVSADLMTWAMWFEKSDRRVKVDTVGESRISTVFLGLDHSFGSDPPLLFETIVFGGPLDGDEERYSTWEEAESGHAKIVARVKASSLEEKTPVEE